VAGQYPRTAAPIRLGRRTILGRGAWQAVVILATIAFVSWALREVDICRKLEMGYHVPLMFSFAISAWVTLQIIRPLWMGCWCERFDLSYSGHLTWVSNTGFRYQNFYLNPFHAYAILGFFLDRDGARDARQRNFRNVQHR
jgi:photosynthetic reaction center L subunit